MEQKIRRRRVQGDDIDTDNPGQKERRRPRMPNENETSFKTCLQFIVMSALIPGLLFLRMAKNDDESFLKYKLTIPQSLPEPFEFLVDLLGNYRETELDPEWLDSDVCELRHCKSILTTKDAGFWGNFTTWAKPWVNETLKQLLRPEIGQEQLEILEQEIILELLELYGTQEGYCKFHRYKPTIIPTDNSAREVLLETANLQPPERHARCAFVISIRKRGDAAHVQRLVQAIHMPHHFVVLHLEQPQTNTHDPFVTEILNIERQHSNVVVLQFGTIHKDREDSMSTIQLKIMRWLSVDLHLAYDYHVTLDGASFPLLSAGEMAKRLYESHESVWLGALTEQGQMSHDSQKMRLVNKRLATTSIQETAQLGAMFPAKQSLPDYLANAESLLSQKTTSGSYAVFSQRLIRQILNSPKALQVFAMSKYGCCSTDLDSYNWMASLQLLSSDPQPQSTVDALLKQAKTNTAMFQLWGGTKDDGNCNSAVRYRGTEAGATLTMDPSRCYRIEHPVVVRNETLSEDWTIPREKLTFHGGEDLMTHLRRAKRRGFLFARQFESTDPQSQAVLEAIDKESAMPTT